MEYQEKMIIDDIKIAHRKLAENDRIIEELKLRIIQSDDNMEIVDLNLELDSLLEYKHELITRVFNLRRKLTKKSIKEIDKELLYRYSNIFG